MDTIRLVKPDQYLTVAVISATPEFRRITSAKMAKWTRVYLQGYLDTGRFDSTAATRAAYTCKSAESYRTLGCQIRSAKKVKAVVELFLATGQRDIIFDLADVQRHLDAAQPGSVAAQQLLRMKNSIKRRGRHEGTQPDEAEDSPLVEAEVQATRRPAIGDIVEYEGKRYKVTALDPEGNPSAGDPVNENGQVIPE